MKSYAELIGYMRLFHLGKLDRAELVAAIALWQHSGAPK